MKILSTKNIFLYFAIVFLTAIVTSSFAFAAGSSGCITDEIKEKFTENASKAFDNFSKSLQNYNNAAKAYTESCGGITTGSGFTNVSDIKSYAGELHISMTDADFQYTSANWNATNSDDPSCKSKKAAAMAAYNSMVADYTASKAKLGEYKNAKADTCACDDKGNVTCADSSESEEDSSGECSTFPQYQNKLSSCPLCGVFVVILNADANLASISWNSLADPLKEVVIAFFLALLAMETLKAVAAVGGIAPATYLKQVFILGLKAAITITMLSNSVYIYDYFISPVLKGGLEMGLAISKGSGAVCDIESAGGVISSPMLDHSLFDSIYKSVECFNTSATTMPAAGMGLMCHGWEELAIKMWLIGFLMLIFGLMIWLAICFYLVDCTVQLGILTAMLPLLIACWPFKLTQQYSYKGVGLLMNTFFNFVVVGIMLLMGSEIVGFAATGDSNASVTDFAYALNTNNLKKLKELTDVDLISILLIIACGIFAMKLVGKVNQLADSFSQGAGSDIGTNIGGMAASAAKSAAVGIAKPVAKKTLSPIAKLRAGKAGRAATAVAATTRGGGPRPTGGGAGGPRPTGGGAGGPRPTGGDADGPRPTGGDEHGG